MKDLNINAARKLIEAYKNVIEKVKEKPDLINKSVSVSDYLGKETGFGDPDFCYLCKESVEILKSNYDHLKETMANHYCEYCIYSIYSHEAETRSDRFDLFCVGTKSSLKSYSAIFESTTDREFIKALEERIAFIEKTLTKIKEM